jgi:glycogen operon protein
MTGCGNAVDSSQPAALRLILDSLRYWVQEMHVDGFRFDLAVTVARGPKGYDRNSPFLIALAQDPVLAQVKWIAEPWDVGEMDSYQLGNFPSPWRELNGRFRDGVRSFWRGDAGSTAGFAKRLCGSEDIFGWDRRPPTASVNFITSHDGFTLRDLVTYSHKHNEANGEENRDGDDDNHSCNHGVEGETDDPLIQAKRQTAARSLMASVFCSLGVPFVTAGDERWRTQRGNNNAYCHDDDISWVNWDETPESSLMHQFVRELTAFRRESALLRRAAYLTGQALEPDAGPDVTWLDGTGGMLDHSAWHEPGRSCFGMWLRGKAETLLFLFNRGGEAVDFALPEETSWKLRFDTSAAEPFRASVEATVAAKKAAEAREHPVAVFRVNPHTLVCLTSDQAL